MNISCCCHSATGIHLLEILVNQGIKFQAVYTSLSDSNKNLSKIKEICYTVGAKCINSEGVIVTNVTEKDMLSGAGVSILLLLWWPHILKSKEIDAFSYVVNLHPSLLPYGRGKYGYFWSIIDDEPFGATLHLVDEGIDTGRILAQKEIVIDSTSTGGNLYEKGVEACISLFTNEIAIIIDFLQGAPHIKSIFKPTMTGSYHSKKEYKAYCDKAYSEHYTLLEAIRYLRARTFESGNSFAFENNGKTYECQISIQEITD